MKTLRFALPLALVLCAPAVQVFAQDSNSGRDAALGAIAGAIIGHQNGRTLEGAALGAGAGLLVNALSGSRTNDRSAMQGTLVGAAAGAMIGKHNGNTAAGALIGATVGYVVANANQNTYADPVVYRAGYTRRDNDRDRYRDCNPYYEAPRRQVIIVQPRYIEPAPVVYVPADSYPTTEPVVCAQPSCDTQASAVVVDGYPYNQQVIVVQDRRPVVVVRPHPVVVVRERAYNVYRDRDRNRDDRRSDRD